MIQKCFDIKLYEANCMRLACPHSKGPQLAQLSL
jgi:hypothetical protein